MNPVTRTLVLAVLLLAGGLLTALYGLQRASEELGQANLRVELLEARTGALEARIQRVTSNVQALQQRSQKNAQAIESALARSPDWAATPTPPDVAASLCDFASCSDRASTVSAP